MTDPLLRTLSFESLTLDRSGQIIARAQSSAQAFTESISGEMMTMVRVPGGLFQMGTPAHLGYPDEHPLHPVSVPAFWMGQGPVTQAQWRAAGCRARPYRFANSDLPVEQVSWEDAQDFCKRLHKLTGRAYRLPSEAEWEYACRAGTGTPFSCGETLTTEVANYVGDHTYAAEPKGVYRHGPNPAGTFPPNPFGLYDMHGNIWEWCADTWQADYTGASASAAPRNQPGAKERVARGGSWHEPPHNCRSAVRLRYLATEHEDYIGFRVALDLKD